ncbi:MAG: ATPase/protein kinase [Bacteroidetes bacterium GWF2_41_31]|nr:MAG: ATPase/protein kinase [Bacteroidetes bacterium GWF2_41_31]OFZ10216.1 MAG: ATPase/protein kinase [Bacteroidetes bacterium RIFOXYB12_FULL_41_6]
MEKDDHHHKAESALKVNEGIEQPASINPMLENEMIRFRKNRPSVKDFLSGIRAGNRNMLGQAITQIESARTEDQVMATELINACLPFSGKSIRIGITGVPGVGKSTFIETFGLYLISLGKKVAVLAIDPSSTRTKGSILGDKTRMEELSVHTDAFIRPSASSGTLGGVTRSTREALILCEAAGFDVILIETVGVGQSETAVSQLVDFFMLLMLAGGGDELQGIKRGIMEMADLIVINKADGDNMLKANLAKREYENALHLFPPLANGWIPITVTASALKNIGIENTWNIVDEFVNQTSTNGYFQKNRHEQSKHILRETISHALTNHFFNNEQMTKRLFFLEQQVIADKMNPYQAAHQLLEEYFHLR